MHIADSCIQRKEDRAYRRIRWCWREHDPIRSILLFEVRLRFVTAVKGACR